MKASSYFPILVLVLFNSCLFSQNTDPYAGKQLPARLEGMHSIYLLTGMKMNSASSVNTALSGTKAETNFQFCLGYQYWFIEEWSVNASAGIFGAEADVDVTGVKSLVIIPVLFGFNYYPEALALGKVGRVNFGLNMGAYIASGTRSNLGLSNLGSSVVSETVFGIEPSCGIDFIVSNWFRIGPSVSFHALSDFKEVIGKKKNYSGPIFSLNIGLLL